MLNKNAKLKLLICLVVLSFLVSLSEGQRGRIRGIGRPGRVFRRPVGRGLAFFGGYALGSARNRYYPSYYGGYYSNCCYNCGCYGKKRKREAPDFVVDEKAKAMLEEVAAEDVDNCGKKLLCELAGANPRHLTIDELVILTPFKGNGPSDGSLFMDYDEAVWHGRSKHSCKDNYSTCTSTAEDLMMDYWNFDEQNMISSNSTYA